MCKLKMILLLAALGICLALDARTAYAAGGLNCAINATCTGAGIPVVLLKNSTGGYINAHGQNASEGTYPYSICCNATDGSLGYDCGRPLC